MLGTHARVEQRHCSEARIPDRGYTGLHPQTVLILNAEILNRLEPLYHDLVRKGKPEVMQGKHRIDHGRLDAAPVAGLFLMMDDPVPRSLDCPAAKLFYRPFLEPFCNAVEDPKELVYAGIEFFAAYGDAQLLNTERIGKSEFWPDAEHDRKWYRRTPGPTGKFVKAEIKLRRKEHEFDRHRGNFVPLILVKQGEPHFGENAGSFYSAALEDEGPGFRKGSRLGILPQELKGEIGFDRGAEFAAIAVINTPPAVFV